jgi:hypothetical protein
VVYQDTLSSTSSNKSLLDQIKQNSCKCKISNCIHKNVNVITKTKITETTNHSVDVSFNILDKNYQYELVKSYLDSKNQNQLSDEIFNLDRIVDNRLLTDEDITPFKKWYIKNIEFSK